MTRKRMTMKAIRHGCAAISAIALLLCLPAKNVFAQAPAGPMAPPLDNAEIPSRSPISQAAARPPRKPIGGHPDLSGSWIINRDDSDDPRQKLRAANEESGNTGNPRRGGWGLGGPLGNPGGGPYGGTPGGNPKQDPQGTDDPAADLYVLSVEQTATTAVVKSSSGVTLANYSAPNASDASPANSAGDASGSSSSPNASGSSTSSGSANSSGNSKSSSKTPVDSVQWQGSQFVTVTQETSGAKTKTTRTYELSSDGSQLEVTTKLEGPHFKQPVRFQLVYDPKYSDNGN